ncbi:MAG: hypothetical protein OXK80_00665 [Bdellovibrionales bacterium]|nr:hypothetical protein [Bdellovibrionales bacterium]
MRYLLFLFIVLFITSCGGSNANESESGKVTVSCICSGQPINVGQAKPAVMIVPGTGGTVEEAKKSARAKCLYVFLPDSCTTGAVLSIPLPKSS